MATTYDLEVRPRVPDALHRLPELARDLVYSWDRDVRLLFRYIDNALYDACGSNPTLFLRRVSQARLDAAASDPAFLRAFHRALSAFDSYHDRRLPDELRKHLSPSEDLVAYFCFEFGFHESLPIYSGGLGILAADHCKAASDLALPLVAVGLMYHQGFFEQQLDLSGRQIERYRTTDLPGLPLDIVRDGAGEELRIEVPIADRVVPARIWEGSVGHTRLFLLDTDIPDNPPEFRWITHRLYGGDRVNRIRQSIVLGIGGVRALERLGLSPSVWHVNEGHGAFQALERCRPLMAEGASFDEALEIVAAATVFTTHTPVPAGHDVYDHATVAAQLGPYLGHLGVPIGTLLAVGHNDVPDHLNMTALGLRGSRHHNGVSRIHRRVASRNEAYVWPEVPPDESPLSCVTNGVHLQTFLALEWVNLFDLRFGDWRGRLTQPGYWDRIDEISDRQFWSVRQELKAQLLTYVRRRLMVQHRRNGLADSTIERMLSLFDRRDGDVLVLGFARRFATYKRATLLLSDPERLARLLCAADRPVLLLIAGKAHPEDEPGKGLIREIHELSMRPEISDRVHLIENYDLALARRMVAGVDVWVNTPEYPLEACGTSGMKAAINGVLNLSMLDGWWAEAFDGSNGWGITPHDHGFDAAHRFREEAEDLLGLLEREVIPTFFEGPPPGRWIERAKASMRTILPRFNAERMVREYVERFYAPAARGGRALRADGLARERVAWKAHVRTCWPAVTLERKDPAPRRLEEGESLDIEIRVELAGLAPRDVRVECVVRMGEALPDGADEPAGQERRVLALTHDPDGPADTFRLRFRPPFPGLQTYRIRMYPCRDDLAHPFELGLMRWL